MPGSRRAEAEPRQGEGAAAAPGHAHGAAPDHSGVWGWDLGPSRVVGMCRDQVWSSASAPLLRGAPTPWGAPAARGKEKGVGMGPGPTSVGSSLRLRTPRPRTRRGQGRALPGRLDQPQGLSTMRGAGGDDAELCQGNTGQFGAIKGDMGQSQAIWGNAGRCEVIQGDLGQCRVIWGTGGRFGAIQGYFGQRGETQGDLGQ